MIERERTSVKDAEFYEMKGNPVSRGYAIGGVYRYEQENIAPDESPVAAECAGEALGHFERAKKTTLLGLEAIVSRLRENGDDKAAIFAAQKAMLDDAAIDEEIRACIEGKLWNPEQAVYETYNKYIKVMQGAKDPVFRERAADLEDVERRLLFALRGRPVKSLAILKSPCVVVCKDLLPSDCVSFDRENVLGIVAEEGGETSHSAIISRSYEIPAILGVSEALSKLKDGQTVVADAVEGVVYADPDEGLIETYRQKSVDFLRAQSELKEYKPHEPLTADGKRIDIMLNIGDVSAVVLENEQYSDGVGLFRTEFLYMESKRLPSEEEQFEAYKKVLSVFGGRPVTLRTLDIGGDKTLPYFDLPEEENPFLGQRALRLCFERPEIFRTQLRAAFRASVFGSLWLMLPMVATMEDIRDAKKIIEDVRSELRGEGRPFSDDVKIGIMVEVPSIALISDMAAGEVDFASIGTNDLIQYTLAADRMNAGVSGYYQRYNPAVFRLIGTVADAFAKAGKPICVCGEMGGDPLAAAVLIGLGVGKLSMNVSSVAPVKKMLAGITKQDARGIADTVLELSTAAECERFLRGRLG